jgi:hypothetical protein
MSPMRLFRLIATVIALAISLPGGPVAAQETTTDRYAGTFVGNNIVGAVTVQVTRVGDGYLVQDLSSAPGMQGNGSVDEAGVLRGEFVVRLLGFTRSHRFALRPEGDGFRYRTTGQDTALQRFAIVDGSAESRFWFDALAGRQLAAFDRYSSGGSTYGGTTSEKRATLCRDGTFTYRARSQFSMSGDGLSASGSSSDGGEGRWRIFSQGGVTLIEVRFTDGRVEQLQLTRQGDQIFVAGERYLRGDVVC